MHTLLLLLLVKYWAKRMHFASLSLFLKNCSLFIVYNFLLLIFRSLLFSDFCLSVVFCCVQRRDFTAIVWAISVASAGRSWSHTCVRYVKHVNHVKHITPRREFSRFWYKHTCAYMRKKLYKVHLFTRTHINQTYFSPSWEKHYIYLVFASQLLCIFNSIFSHNTRCTPRSPLHKSWLFDSLHTLPLSIGRARLSLCSISLHLSPSSARLVYVSTYLLALSLISL